MCKKEKWESTLPPVALPLSKGLVNQEEGMGLERPDFTAGMSGQASLYKFARQ
jgi:hypothetical protein